MMVPKKYISSTLLLTIFKIKFLSLTDARYPLMISLFFHDILHQNVVVFAAAGVQSAFPIQFMHECPVSSLSMLLIRSVLKV